jgi:hypothetical protein
VGTGLTAKRVEGWIALNKHAADLFQDAVNKYEVADESTRDGSSAERGCCTARSSRMCAIVICTGGYRWSAPSATASIRETSL